MRPTVLASQGRPTLQELTVRASDGRAIVPEAGSYSTLPIMRICDELEIVMRDQHLRRRCGTGPCRSDLAHPLGRCPRATTTGAASIGSDCSETVIASSVGTGRLGFVGSAAPVPDPAAHQALRRFLLERFIINWYKRRRLSTHDQALRRMVEGLRPSASLPLRHSHILCDIPTMLHGSERARGA